MFPGREEILRKQIQAAMRCLLTNGDQDKQQEGSVDGEKRLCAGGHMCMEMNMMKKTQCSP